MTIATANHAPGVRIEWPDTNAQQLDTGRTDVAGFLGLAERGPLHTAVKVESMRQFRTSFGEHIEDGCLAYGVESYFANGGRTCWVVRVADPDGARPARLRVRLAGASFMLEAVSPGKWGDGVEVQALWSPAGVVALRASEGERSQRIELGAPSGAPKLLDAGGERSLLGVPTASLPELGPEFLVRVLPDQFSAGPAWTPSGAASAFLAGGADGRGKLLPHHFGGGAHLASPRRWGIETLELVDGIAVVAAPDLMLAGFATEQVREVQIAILAHCMARHDRVALLDLPQLPVPAALSLRKQLPESRFGALYYPWIAVNDPLRGRGALRMIPPSTAVAGVVARCDRLRGVHKPPANELLEGVSSVSLRIDEPAHAQLNEAGINAIRALPGRGVLVLGARSLDLDPSWRYLNVRRLFNMIEEALEEQMQWLTFEPNNPRLWKEVDRAVRGFLERLYRAGMLDGATSADAYSVRCDASTNPPSSTDEGKVLCLIGVQPPYPAEFVVVRVGLTRSGIDGEQKGGLDG